MVSYLSWIVAHKGVVSVLILIVVDNGLIQRLCILLEWRFVGLNPYCSGQWSHTDLKIEE